MVNAKKKLETFAVASDDGKLTVELAIDHATGQVCITPRTFVAPLWNKEGVNFRDLDRERFTGSPATSFAFQHGDPNKWAEIATLIHKAALMAKTRIEEEKVDPRTNAQI